MINPALEFLISDSLEIGASEVLARCGRPTIRKGRQTPVNGGIDSRASSTKALYQMHPQKRQETGILYHGRWNYRRR